VRRDHGTKLLTPATPAHAKLATADHVQAPLPEVA
jgi:hypothetical protein